jgi:NAD(P)-dependent dehydrogenase (short-subunit alcohol dehydrogenase family)
VVLAARREDAVQSAAADIEADGGRASGVAMDVTMQSSVDAALAAVAARLGSVDILVNNAGVTLTKPFLDIAEEEWDLVVDTNLKGAFLVGQSAARIMKSQPKGGVIVNISSIIGHRVAGQVAPYAVSKAALLQLTKAMALELARFNIRVNALCPGYIETDLNRDFFNSDTGKSLIKRIPQRRLGRADELEGALLLLCSDAGSLITGADLSVDGGHLVSSL